MSCASCWISCAVGFFCAYSAVVYRMCSQPHLVSTPCPEAPELGQRSLTALPGISQLGNLLAPNLSGGEDAIWVLLEVSHAGKSHFAGYKQRPFPQHSSFMERCCFLWYIAVSHQFYTFNCAIPELQLLDSLFSFSLRASPCPTSLYFTEAGVSSWKFPCFCFSLREMLNRMFQVGFWRQGVPQNEINLTFQQHCPLLVFFF